MSLVYCHLKATNGDPFYVGIGSTKRRPFEIGSRRSEWHRRVTEKHGIRVEILIDDIDWKTAGWWEKRWIKALKSFDYALVNHTEGGDGVCNASPETLLKMRLSSKKRWSSLEHRKEHSLRTKQGMDSPEVRQKVAYMKGKIHSEKTKQKMSISHTLKGKDETLRKIRSINASGEKNPFFGKKHSDESRLSMSLALKGRVSPNLGVKFSEEHKNKLKAAWVIRRSRKVQSQ